MRFSLTSTGSHRGLPDLILTAWTVGRDEPLKLFGPEGAKHMADKVLEAYEEDIRYRLYSEQPANNEGWRVETREIRETGLVFEDDNVKVEAFRVPHGSWPEAWGYRFTTPDKVIVISGDTAPSDVLKQYYKVPMCSFMRCTVKRALQRKSLSGRNITRRITPRPRS